MAAHLPPPIIPPFDYPRETIDEAVQEALDFQAQLKLQSRQLVQLARRQDALNGNYGAIVTAVDRLADRQTAHNALSMLALRRMKKLLDRLQVPDVEDAAAIEAEFL